MRNLKRALSLLLSSTMVLGMLVMGSSAVGYQDVDASNDHQEAIEVLQQVGIMTGDENGNFDPDGSITRNEMAVVMAHLLNLDYDYYRGVNTFTDVPSWAAPYVAACVAEGVTAGIGNNLYGGDQPITAAQGSLMIMKALGYFQNQEDFGSDWQVATIRQASYINLFDRVNSDADSALTRAQVAQLVLNGLKSNMVTFTGDKGVQIGDVTVGYHAEYTPVTNAAAKYNSIVTGTTTIIGDNGQYYVQLGEELYNGDLKLANGDDDFMRPSRVWSYKGTEIGTYAKKELMVESYTAGVSGKTMYDLLSAATIEEYDLATYWDGKDNTIEKNDLVRSNKDNLDNTGNGVVTEVYVDNNAEEITIVSINTYLAKATADYNETKEYAPLNVYLSDANGRSYNVDVEEVAEVANVTADTFYQVNVSYKDNTNGEVKVINDVKVLEDSTVTKFSAEGNGNGSGKVTKLTTDGTEYSRNAKAYYDDDILDEYDAALLTDATYNVYVDANGYFLGVDLYEGTKNYVFITGYDLSGSHIAVKTADAAAIFLDGTMSNIKVNVKETNDNIDAATGHNAAYFTDWTNPGNNELNQWYTYTVDASGNYTLKPAVRMTWTKYSTGVDQVIRTDNLSIQDSQGNGDRVYGEDATVFITADTDDVSNGASMRGITEVTGVYTGVQEVEVEIDTTSADALRMGQIFTVYDNDWYVIGAVVLGDAVGADDNLAYILSRATSEEKKDDTYYWTFDAIMNGQVQTFTARSKYQSTIQALAPNTVQELRFDGDYVTNIKALDASDLYTNNAVNINGESVYQMTGLTAGVNTLNLQGRTLYITANRTDMGLALAADAKAVVIQDENKSSDVKTEFSSVSAAISHLADPDGDTSNGTQYVGDIFAILDSNGVAQWVVFNSSTALNTGSDGNYGTGDQYTYNAWTDVFGQVHATVNYVRPAYVPANDNVAISFEVYANGQYVGTVTDTMGSGNNQYNYPTGFGSGFMVPSGSKIELRNVTFTPANVNVKYVDANGTAVKVVSSSTQTLPVGTSASIWFNLLSSDYNAGSYNYTINGTKATTAPTGTGAVDTTVGPVNVIASGKDYVTVVISGLSNVPVTHTVTGLTATRFDAINSNITGGDAAINLTVTPASLTGVADGASVTFTATVDDSAFTVAQAYRVVIEKAGISGIVYNDGSTHKNISLTGSKVITDDVTITAADVKITPVAFTKLIGVTWTKDSVTLSFDGPVDVASAALAEAAFADTNATLVNKTASSVTSVTYTVTNGFLAAGDTLTLDLSKLTHATYGGAVVSADGTNIALVAGGTATLS